MWHVRTYRFRKCRFGILVIKQFIEFGFCMMWIKKHADLPTPLGTICLIIRITNGIGDTNLKTQL